VYCTQLDADLNEVGWLHYSVAEAADAGGGNCCLRPTLSSSRRRTVLQSLYIIYLL